MKFHSGTHSGTAVSGLETANFSIIQKRGKDNQIDISYGEKVIRLEGDATMIYDNGLSQQQTKSIQWKNFILNFLYF